MLKKVIAGAAFVAAAAFGVSSLVSGAAVNDTAATYDDATDSIVVTATHDFSTDGIATFSVLTSTGVVVDTTGATFTGSNGQFELSTGSLDALDGNYTFSFVTDGGVYGAAVFAANSANTVVVSANVLPILSMGLSSNTIDLGDLNVSSVNSDTMDITIATNAVNGYELSVAATGTGGNAGLYDSVSDSLIPASDNLVAGTSGFDVYVSATALGGGSSTGITPSADFDATNDGGDAVLANAAASMVTTDGTTDGDTITVTYEAAVDSVQAAGNYTTNVTYTVTGSF